MFEQQAKWSDLLNEAVSNPGLILKAYTAFHGYSVGNQIAAMIQCVRRGLQPGPINTYQGWQSLGRQVKKGERAIWLCMPLKRKVKDESGDEVSLVTNFVWRPHWFVISQTVGEPYNLLAIPSWDKARALSALGIMEVEFTELNGNVQGYARKKEIAISPLAELPHKTLFHELAHVELGHTQELAFTDSEQLPRAIREVEAEAVALIMCESLKLPGVEFCRGYIQSYLEAGEVILEKSAQRIFGTADRLLKAGR